MILDQDAVILAISGAAATGPVAMRDQQGVVTSIRMIS